MLGNSRERDQLKSTAKQTGLCRQEWEQTKSVCRILRFWSEARRRSECSPEMFRAGRRQSHSWEMEDTDSFTAQAWTRALGRTAPNAASGIEEDARQHLREMERDGLVVRKNLSSLVLHVE
jgi:hypothetical protein